MNFVKAIAASALVLTVAPAAFAASLSFTLEEVEARGGTLYVGVQTKAQFMQDDGIAGEKISNPEAGTHTFEFDLPEGDYSVSVWHDLDDNNEFDRNDYGMPLDGWAMINGASLRGVPEFEQVKVTLTAEGVSATEMIVYPN